MQIDWMVIWTSAASRSIPKPIIGAKLCFMVCSSNWVELAGSLSIVCCSAQIAQTRGTRNYVVFHLPPFEFALLAVHRAANNGPRRIITLRHSRQRSSPPTEIKSSSRPPIETLAIPFRSPLLRRRLLRGEILKLFKRFSRFTQIEWFERKPDSLSNVKNAHVCKSQAEMPLKSSHDESFYGRG